MSHAHGCCGFERFFGVCWRPACPNTVQQIKLLFGVKCLNSHSSEPRSVPQLHQLRTTMLAWARRCSSTPAGVGSRVVKVGSLPQNQSELSRTLIFCISMVPICLIQAAIKAQVAPVAGSLKVPMTKFCTSGHLRKANRPRNNPDPSVTTCRAPGCGVERYAASS
jgi:hypothetical protein